MCRSSGSCFSPKGKSKSAVGTSSEGGTTRKVPKYVQAVFGRDVSASVDLDHLLEELGGEDVDGDTTDDSDKGADQSRQGTRDLMLDDVDDVRDVINNLDVAEAAQQRDRKHDPSPEITEEFFSTTEQKQCTDKQEAAVDELYFKQMRKLTELLSSECCAFRPDPPI